MSENRFGFNLNYRPNLWRKIDKRKSVFELEKKRKESGAWVYITPGFSSSISRKCVVNIEHILY